MLVHVCSQSILADRIYMFAISIVAMRKRLLLIFAVTGSLATICFFPLTSSSPVWLLSAPIAIVANICFGASMVCLNAYLGGLARGMPECIAAAEQVADVRLDDEEEEEEGDARGTTREAYYALLSQTTSFISARGIAAGYVGGIIVLLVALVPVSKLHGSTLSLRLAIGMSGVWWLLFTIRKFRSFLSCRACV
jgi:UMF1 family MFS transporter